jgi:light-regulated signal transduction histidine kinase (bacteriophytochrome)
VTWRLADGLTVWADPAMARVVLENLLGNAMKYTARTSQPVVTLERLTSGTEEVYVVRDNGAGFDMRYAEKLFAPFQRLHRPDEFEGTGVGLALVQRIIHRHGGRIWAEGTPGEGASFFFTFGHP